MEIICPNCGQTCEVDEEPAIGQHLLCPFCDVEFKYTPQNTTEPNIKSILSRLCAIAVALSIGIAG